MKARGAILVSIVLAGSLLALSSDAGGLTARQQRTKEAAESLELLRLRRKVNRLRQKAAVREIKGTSATPEFGTTCYAISENDAREKLLALLLREQQMDIERGLADGTRPELDRYPVQMTSWLCAEGIPEEEKLAIAAELSSHYTWSLSLNSQIVPKDPDHFLEMNHQIIKKHLGEERYASQSRKCDKATDERIAFSMVIGMEHFGAILGLSAQQKEEAKTIYEKLQFVRYGIGEDVFDDSNNVVPAQSNALGNNGVTGDSSPGAGSHPLGRELQLQQKFFSLLTPEQEMKYRLFLDDRDYSMDFLTGTLFGMPDEVEVEAEGSAP